MTERNQDSGLKLQARFFVHWVRVTVLGFIVAYLVRGALALLTVPFIADLLGMSKEAVVGLIATWLPGWLMLLVCALIGAGFWYSDWRATANRDGEARWH